MKKIKINKFINFLKLFSRSNDPVYSCKLYKDKDCSHVDGYLCDFPKCSINLDYLNELTVEKG